MRPEVAHSVGAGEGGGRQQLPVLHELPLVVVLEVIGAKPGVSSRKLAPSNRAGLSSFEYGVYQALSTSTACRRSVIERHCDETQVYPLEHQVRGAWWIPPDFSSER